MDKVDTYNPISTVKDGSSVSSMSSGSISAPSMSIDSYATTSMATDTPSTATFSLASAITSNMTIDSVSTDLYFDLLGAYFDKKTTYFDIFQLDSMDSDNIGLETMTKD